MSIAIGDISGLILCGGRGSRMGGVDKGLQNYQGMPLAMHALLRLSPQVGPLMINANRNLAAYESMGVPVWPDPIADYPGPLAGWLAGIERCETPYMVVVPCDSPHFPVDLVERLSEALEREGADIAMAATVEDGRLQVQPVFCLLKTMLLESLVQYLHGGDRKIDRWTAQHRCAQVVFEDSQAFFNANTLEELHRLPGGPA
ncbi:MAG: molybdenum cofactor guanylyltransferase MobA [Burkholderiaceae bacterium]|jgi:molybdopterin-guanine dinucleotide biosynthesis protein A|nr:molybdenum cofactor guanylyltransferase MobA [Burkholderiaceae bacterium]